MHSLKLSCPLARFRKLQFPRLYPCRTAASTATQPNWLSNKVKERDYEGYMLTQFFPANFRNAAFALRAFNLEVASIKDIAKV
jgi:hypothetical protein